MNFMIFIVAIITLALDQVSKLVIYSIVKYDTSINVITNFFRINPNNNYGAAWGLFSGKIIFLITLSLIGAVIIYRFMRTFKLNKRNTIAFGLLIGGIMGNLSDRIILGYVRDFADFNFGAYYFPVFNVADSCLFISVVLLIIAILKGEDKNENNK